jgi:exoribonuclease II
VDEFLQRKLAKEAAEKELEEFVHLLKSAKALPMDSKPPKSSWLIDDKVRQKIEALQAYTIDACDDEQRRLAGNVKYQILLSKFFHALFSI